VLAAAVVIAAHNNIFLIIECPSYFTDCYDL